MTDTIMDSGQPDGSVEEPTQPVSQGAGVQQHSSDAVKSLEATLKELQGQVRALQGDKDRGVHEVKSQVSDLMKQLAWLKKAEARGLTPEEIEEQLELKAILAERRRGTAANVSPDTQDGTRGQATGVDTKAFLQSIGLAESDPDVTAAYAEHGNDPSELVVRLANIVTKRKQAQQQAPKPSQVMSGGGGQSVAGVSPDTLKTEYEQLTKNIPPGEWGTQQRFDVKLAIRKKAKEAGVQSPV